MSRKGSLAAPGGNWRAFVALWPLPGVLLGAGCDGDAADRSLAPIEFDGKALHATWREGVDEESFAVTLVLTDDDEEVLLYRGSLDTGGLRPTWENFRPETDRAPELTLCVNGSGQADRSVRIDTNSKIVLEVERPCTD